MKKLFATILATCLLATLSVTAFAADVDQDSESKSGATKVSFNVDPTYTVTIPATVTLEKKTVNNIVTYENDLTISASNVRLTQNSGIAVSLDSDYTMKVTDAVASNPYQLPYKVFVDETEITAESNTVALFGTNKDNQSTTLHITADDPEYAGTYTDTVTFTIKTVY